MEKFDEIKYKGFKTDFYITDKVLEFLKRNKISLEKLKERYDNDNENYSFFYEVLFFDILDEDNDGIPDKKFGKNFKIVYYIAKKIRKEYNKELEHETLNEIKDEENILDKIINKGNKEIELSKNLLLDVGYKILRGL